MDTATVLNDRRPQQVPDGPKPVETGRVLAVTASYFLSEEGRKASLLVGGNGRALQEIMIDVPSNRLHLVSVDANGQARLKLRPRFQLSEDQRVTRSDSPPEYDAPPSLEELFREAARNHQLEATYQIEKRTTRSKRRDSSRDLRADVAKAFLGDAQPARDAYIRHRRPSAAISTPSGDDCYSIWMSTRRQHETSRLKRTGVFAPIFDRAQNGTSKRGWLNSRSTRRKSE